MNKCRCINCLFYSDGKCDLRDKEIDYPYADKYCFLHADKEKENDVQRDHNKGA